MVKKINVTGDEAFKYLRSQLSFGSKFLSKKMLEIPLEEGEVFAFVPENISYEVLFNFERGGLYKTNKDLMETSSVLPVQNESKLSVINIIHEFIEMDNCNCCVFEEPNAKPSDPFIINSNFKFNTIKDEIFYFINKENNDLKEIEFILDQSESYYLTGVLTSIDYSNHKRINQFNELEPEILEKVVQNIKSFFSIAYDHEGYLLWSQIE